MWYFLIGFLPFINPLRAFPLPSFWQDIGAFCLLMAWLLFLPRNKSIAVDRSFKSNSGVFALVLLIIFNLIQQSIGMVNSHHALQNTVVLFGGILVHLGAKTVAENGRLEEILVPWSFGIVLSMLMNVASAELARHELEWVLNRWVASIAPVRDGGFFGQPNQYGVFCVLSLVAWRYLYVKGRVNVYLYYLVSLIGFWAVARSGSRAAVVVWIGVSGLDLWLNSIRFRSFIGEWSIRQVLFFSCQLIYFGFLNFSAVGEMREPVAGAFRGGAATRFEQWRDAWMLIWEHPFLGVGAGNFASARFFELKNPMAEPQANHTHNIFSNLIVEFGLGAVVVLILLLILVLLSWRGEADKKERGAEAVLLGGWVLGLFLYSNFEYPLWYPSFLYIFLFLSGLAIGGAAGRQSGVFLRFYAFPRAASAFMLAIGLVAAFDYWRIQGGLLQTLEILEGKPVRDIENSDVMRIRVATLFLDEIDGIWIDVSDPRDGAALIKFPIVERLFKKTPSIGGAAQYIMYAIAAGRERNADFVYNRMYSSNTILGERLRLYLNEFARTDPALKTFLARQGARKVVDF